MRRGLEDRVWTGAAARLLLLLLLTAAGPSRAITIDEAASELGTAQLTDLSGAAELFFVLDLVDPDPVALVLRLDPSETGGPIRLDALLTDLTVVALRGVDLELLGAGASFRRIGAVRDARGRDGRVFAEPGRVAVRFPTLVPVREVELGDPGGDGATPWEIDPAGLAELGLRVTPVVVPEPGGLLALGLLGLGVARRRRWVPALALLVGLAGVAPAVRAADVIVNSSVDGSIGSLRTALERFARPGDRIVFQVGQVFLDDPLEVPRELTGLSIVGPVAIRPSAGLRGLFTVLADNVTIENVTFQDVNVFTAGFGAVRTGGLAVRGCQFRGDASLFLDQAIACTIESNQFQTQPRGDDIVLGLSRTESCDVIGNTFDSSVPNEISDESSLDLTLRDNTLAHTLFAAPRSGTIEDNRADRLRVYWSDFFGSQSLRIEGNTLRSMRVVRTDVTIRDNTLDGRPAGGASPRIVASLVNSDPKGATGPFRFDGNDVRGGRLGVLYSEVSDERSGAGFLTGNQVRDATDTGMRVLRARRTEVAGNTVEDCGQGTGGEGIDLARPATSEVTVSGNQIRRIRGVGLRVSDPEGAAAVSGNLIEACRAAGVELVGGPARTRLDQNTIRRNDGPGVDVRDADAEARIAGGAIHENGNAGVLARSGSRSEITQVSFRGNAGPGIDLVPLGVTPNEVLKTANDDLDWPEALRIDPDTGQLVGLTVPNGRVEVFAIESGPRQGNPENGEGDRFLGAVVADAAGRFAFPAEGALDCDEVERLTLTATTPGADPVTSEFSPDVACEPPSFVIDLGDREVRCAQDCEEEVFSEGTCSECRVSFDDGTELDCSGVDSVCRPFDALCERCELTAPGLSIDCTGALCGRGFFEGWQCEGDAGECAADFPDGRSFSCPTDLGCTTVVTPSGLDPADAGLVRVTKETIDGDGSFLFPILSTQGPPIAEATIPTEDGVGTSIAQIVTAEPVLIREQLLPPAEIAALDCVGARLLDAVDELSRVVAPPPGATTTCTWVNRFPPPTDVLPSGGVRFPETVTRTGSFGLPPGHRVAVAGENGFAIVDVATGRVPVAGRTTLAFLFRGFTLGAFVLENPFVEDADGLFSYGDGTSQTVFDPEVGEFGLTLLGFEAAADAFHRGGDETVNSAFLVASAGVSELSMAIAEFGSTIDSRLVATFDQFGGFSAPALATGFVTADGSHLLAANNAGILYLLDLAAPRGTAATEVGQVGRSPRRLRCASGLCAVSDFALDRLTLIAWDGGANASILGDIASSQGPLGIDVRPANGAVSIASAGFFDQTVRVTDVTTAGRVLADVALAAPEGCVDPAYAIWLRDAAQSVAVSCNGSDAIAVIPSADFAPAGRDFACGLGFEGALAALAIRGLRRRRLPAR
ncbi:MAG: right-handed parallel beta-helix repeat-containing protein [Myxococcota bacterium]|nr:right-handed parallel beta-helix repeat-containing protein [Myxococcota bacterium]